MPATSALSVNGGVVDPLEFTQAPHAVWRPPAYRLMGAASGGQPSHASPLIDDAEPTSTAGPVSGGSAESTAARGGPAPRAP
jgi:hypothetical protein